MNIATAERCERALELHVGATGRANFTAIELHEILGSETSAEGMELIGALVDSGRLQARAIYVDMQGCLHEFGADAYASAIAANGFTDPLNGMHVEGCIELSPFWAYVPDADPSV
ncbi:hypothetical protein [Paracoccus sp. ME4]|uniref:hypothetical protein n=1 Tax=Paracoccus sp. ME4 TaxID=3138066 RepID=UPI00398B9C4E